MTEQSESTGVCTRCVIDWSVPHADFDENGVCRFCRIHDALEKEYPLGEAGARKLDEIAARIKRSGKGRKYDCVVGVSGGRDSTYLLHLAKSLDLKPLAVHFNDGFGNPIAGQNMRKATERLGVEMRTITSNWKESKDIRIACLKASIPDMNLGCDLGIAAALYGVASSEGIGYILVGHTFRTEGISPPEWTALDGKYLKSIHKRFGTIEFKRWKAFEPGYNLGIREMFYYTIIRRIRTITPLCYVDYVRKDVDELLKREFDWVSPGAHYFDDLYQALLSHILRVKFKIDRRKINYGALVRTNQMNREEALQRMNEIYALEDPRIIDLCIKRLGLSKEELEEILQTPVKTFKDYPNHLGLIIMAGPLLKVMAAMKLFPVSVYQKYCGWKVES
jgi:hypothetical protein